MAYKVVYGQEVPLITTWEWIDGYALRSMMYPAYLSIPLSVLKALSIDTNFLVVNSMLAMNSLLQVMGDFFLYLLAKRMIGREGALIAVTYSLFNQKINDIFQKTLTNGAEAALCMCGLYYFSKLKPKFDTNLAIMTISITLAFLVRSSSLVGWVPLALYKIFSGFDYFIAIVTAGIVIAIPVCVLSVLIDSAYYGRFTIPQWNFVYINVVDNISKYFGTEHWSYYIIELRDCIAFSEMFFKFILLGMCFYSIYLSAGVLPFDKKEKSEKFQGFIIFIITNVLILSLIEHKEQRFMTQIFPLFAIYWAFFWLVIIRVSQAVDQMQHIAKTESVAKLVFKVFFWWYAYTESAGNIKLFTEYKPGDPEIYNLLNGRSEVLTDYRDFIEKHPESNFTGFENGIESLYLQTKYDTPVTTYAHTQGEDKTTIIYTPFLLPWFAALKYYGPFKSLPHEFPELQSVRADMSRLQNPDARSIFTLISEIERGAPLPQVIMIGDDYLFEWDLHPVNLLLFRALQEASGGCYELADSFQFRRFSAREYLDKVAFRIVPHKRCLDRMILKNYYKGNRSLGPSMDFEMGFQGYGGPYKERIDEIKREHPELFK